MLMKMTDGMMSDPTNMILYISLTINVILLFLWIRTCRQGVKLAFLLEDMQKTIKRYLDKTESRERDV